MAIYYEIQKISQERADLQASLKLLPYEGTPEIKEVNNKRYLYIKNNLKIF